MLRIPGPVGSGYILFPPAGSKRPVDVAFDMRSGNLPLVFGLTLAPISPALAQRAAAHLPSDIVRRGDSVIVAYMTRHHVPGLSVAIGLDQRLVWSNAYGLADLEDSVRVTTASMFRTASCAFLYLLPAKRIVVAFMMSLESVPDRGDLGGIW